MAKVTQDVMQEWAREIGGAHGAWESEMVKSWFLQGYESAWKHAAKHTVEKVLEIARDVLPATKFEELENALADPETWKK